MGANVVRLQSGGVGGADNRAHRGPCNGDRANSQFVQRFQCGDMGDTAGAPLPSAMATDGG